MTSVVNLQPSPYSFLGGLKVTFIAALGTLLRMPTLYVALQPATAMAATGGAMRQRIGERYYGTQHTTSRYPLNRKSVSCPRAYRAFLVTLRNSNLNRFRFHATALSSVKKCLSRLAQMFSCGLFEIYCAALYNIYGSSRVTDVRTIQINIIIIIIYM